MLNALYESEAVVTIKGDLDIAGIPSPSGKGQIIARCPSCKVAIWSNYDFGGLREHVRFLRVGTLDNPDLMPPDVHIFTSTKVPWYIIPDGQYAVEEFYESRTTWSDESKARMKDWLKRKGLAFDRLDD